MKDYTIVREESEKELKNILLFKNTRRLRVKDHGSFRVHDKNMNLTAGSCTWMRALFSHRTKSFPQLSFSMEDETPQQRSVQKLFDILTVGIVS